MAIYRFKLKDAASGETRSGAASADSREEAVAFLEAQEQGHIEFFLPGDEIKDLEQKLKEGTLRGRDKARLFSHQQTKGYKIESVKESDS